MNQPISLEAKRAEHFSKRPRLQFDPTNGQYSLQGVGSVVDFTEELLWASVHRPVKIDHTALIVQAELETNTGEIVPILLKRFRPRNLAKAITDYFRPDRSRKATRNGQTLLACGVPTAQPLWTAGPRKIPGCLIARETYLATKWLPGTENLHLWLQRLLKLGTPLAERLHRVRACAEQAGQILGRMHAAGISHRDLKATNLLIHDPKTDSTLKTKAGLPDLWLIDMDGVRIGTPASLSHQRRAADLGRLAVSVEAYPWITNSIRAVFLRAYASQFKPDKIDIRRLWKDIAKEANRRLKKKRRRGGPIY